ncbi:GIY-YIG nuclease family protein [Halorhabdus amylolytica]|uniref:GIY-YIG nuclease family protein n=1 Tax=Halorhabdus amylolytica TaxID=2559573 RepID=UPI0010AAD61B|nr:GIY-YIG nuclease family protein [Halorhabdus amylolytica]
MTADQGTYTLVIELAERATITFGAAGEYDLEAGAYAYTGSAFGRGGFARIDRHRELAAGERDASHWHVDYLLGHPATCILEVVTTEGVDIECTVARAIATDCTPIEGIGASDCDCNTHLAAASGPAELIEAIERAHERARDRGT